MEELRQILQEYAARYPEGEICDVVKLLHQNEFGALHTVNDPDACLSRLREELSHAGAPAPSALRRRITSIGNGRCRVPFDGFARDEASVRLLWRMIVSEAQRGGTVKSLSRKLDVLLRMCEQAQLPFSVQEMKMFLARYRVDGCPALRHSEAYRARYAPRYCVVEEADVLFWDVLLRVQELYEREGRAVIALEGRCASGKSTLGARIGALFGAAVFHTDDYFLPSYIRTPSRMTQPGGNFHYERMAGEVIEPLRAGADIDYRPYRCAADYLGAAVHVPAPRLAVVEGAYSTHPFFGKYWDLSVFVSAAYEKRLVRLREREGEAGVFPFIDRWIPFEESYFAEFGVEKRCDLRIDT